MDIDLFFNELFGYIVDVAPVLILGFFLSGLVHEFLPEDFVDRYLARKNFFSVLWAAIIGTILPICCIGQLPIAVSFHRKGARLGPVLAFLVATPATSITALLVTYRLLGLTFTVYIFFAAILMGVTIGLIGNLFTAPVTVSKEEICPHCGEAKAKHTHTHTFSEKIKSVFVYAFWEMPREMGREIAIGLILAALIVSITPIERLISLYLGGAFGYLFALPFGVIMYICSTATVPLVHAFVTSGMNIGAGMLLLLVGPITSFGTLLVVRKEFGDKILWVYLAVICVTALMLGYGFTFVY
jgi:uncharacterized membrane protein YraQ (UPF0718 family)